jgi:hypothetical protein
MLIKPKFASLTAGLLARKGEAHPAATTELTDEFTRGSFLPQRYEPTAETLPQKTILEPTPLQQQALLVRAFETPPEPQLRERLPVVSEPPPPRETRPARVEESSSKEGAAERCPVCPGDPLDERRFHVSVRLKRGRYLRLKLAAASLHKPSQEIISEALDAYFTRLGPDVLGDCPCLTR